MVEVLNSPKKFKIRCPYCLAEVSFTEKDIEYHPSDFKYLKDDYVWCECGRTITVKHNYTFIKDVVPIY